MNCERNNDVLISVEWRTKVVAILASGDKDKIQTTTEADIEWSHTFPNAWDHQRLEAIVLALSTDGITGRHIINMYPKCDAYEFFFHFDGRKVIGKIGLMPSGAVIMIFSSHIPRKGDKL